MSAPLSTHDGLIEKLLAHLRAEGYSLRIQQWYPARVRQLLNYCDHNGLSIETNTIAPLGMASKLDGAGLRAEIKDLRMEAGAATMRLAARIATAPGDKPSVNRTLPPAAPTMPPRL
ncbi:hypothetical protein PTKU46_85780 [Paraburkholderia terrae]